MGWEGFDLRSHCVSVASFYGFYGNCLLQYFPMFLFWLLCKYDNTCNVCSQVKWWDFEASTLVTDTLWFQTAVFCQRRCGIREVSLNGKSTPNFHPKQAGRSLLASHAPLSAELHCCAISCERYFGMVFDICAFMCRFSLGQYRHFTRRSKGSSGGFDLQVLQRVNNNNSRSSTKDNLNIQFHPKVQGLIKDHNLSKPILSAHVRSFEKKQSCNTTHFEFLCWRYKII